MSATISTVTWRKPPRCTASPNTRSVASSTRNLLPGSTTSSTAARSTRSPDVVASRKRATAQVFSATTSSSTSFNSTAVSSVTRKDSVMTAGNSCTKTPSTTVYAKTSTTSAAVIRRMP